VNFNEQIDLSSVQPSDLVLSGIGGAFVSGVAVLPGITTARFTISGLTTTEGSLTPSIVAGAITDTFGNPVAAFSATYQVDIGTVPYPIPLTPKNPVGSLIYDPAVAGVINFADDVDSFSLPVDPGQTITLVVTPTSTGLWPRVQLQAPSSAVIGSAVAETNGSNALMQTISATTGGIYTITVVGQSHTTGSYQLQVILNAAQEEEDFARSLERHVGHGSRHKCFVH
jgi:hypothetical protein